MLAPELLDTRTRLLALTEDSNDTRSVTGRGRSAPQFFQESPVLGVHRIASTESQRLRLRKGQREAYDRNPLCPLCSTSDQDENSANIQKAAVPGFEPKSVNFC
jgi:hypothetical protein